jgi:hypothetical protein
LLGGSIILFALGFVMEAKPLGSLFVAMMFSGFFTRALFYCLLFVQQRAARNPRAKWAAFNAAVMTLFAVAFFVFVVLFQLWNPK